MSYIRTSIMDFSELSNEEQVRLINDSGLEVSELNQDQFVQDPCSPSEYIPLSNFIRLNSKIWTGYYGQTYFSAYFIKIDHLNSQAVVAFRHW